MEIAKSFTILLCCLSWSNAVLITNMRYARVKEGLCPTYNIMTYYMPTKISCGEICYQPDLYCMGFCYSKSQMTCHIYTIAFVKGLTVIQNQYYGFTFFSSAVLKATASASCRSFGSYLSMPQNLQENQFLQGYSSNSLWLGGNDTAQTYYFVSDVDGQHITYTNWGSGDPNNSGGSEKCIQMKSSALWIDISCLDSYPYCCQSPAFGCPNAPKGTKGENAGETCYLKTTS